MSGIEGIAAAGAEPRVAETLLGGPVSEQNAPVAGGNFGELISRGLAQVEGKIETANEMVRAFALDDSIPVHQVTIALEEARLSVEMALQVRNRLVEGYREIMNMQL